MVDIGDRVYQMIVVNSVENFGIKEGNRIYKQFCDKYIGKHYDNFMDSILSKKTSDFFEKMYQVGATYMERINNGRKIGLTYFEE